MKRLFLCLLSACALHLAVSAHVLDQYLQVARIALATDGIRIELRLVPGVQVADRVFALMDVDGDGEILHTEEQAYARRVLQDVTLEVDGRRVPLVLTGIQFPSRREMSEGTGEIRLALSAEAALGAAGEHQLSFRNDHLPELGVYLANALVPATNEIKITRQERDALQHGLRINFHSTPAATHGRPSWIGAIIFCLCLALLLLVWKRLRDFSFGQRKLFLERRQPSVNTLPINVE